MHVLLLANFTLALYLTGLIWTVQVLHYPSFGLVGAAEWAAFHRAHTSRITPLVMGPMLLELILGGWLAWQGGGWVGKVAYVFVLIIWAQTAFVAVPLHNRLAVRFDLHLVDRLVRTNWIRTLAWTARAGLLGWLIWREGC
jgi:hypothetical protein